MLNLVEIRNQQAVTSSQLVADVFKKQHKHVLEAIEKVKVENSAVTTMFYESTYTAGTGKAYKMYYMNRDGLSLLVMGFTGKKALEWKLKYIEAFNQMEEKLKTPKLTPNPHYRTRMIKTAVKDLSETADVIAELFGVKKGMATAAAMKMVGSAYGIDTAPLMPLLPAESTPCYMTPTAIAKRLGILNKKGNPDPKEVNRRLAEAGLQERRDKEWILTDKGKEYGEAKPYTNNGHSGYVINWYDTVLEVLPAVVGA
ncbi:MAG: Rha family transcriptional regulator [Selenomonas sp.]|nr:Rha family transcriptional regulator [Selenomonas sp.]